MNCRACGTEAETRYVSYNQNIGFFVMRFTKSIRGNFCADCASRRFYEYTLTTLCLGWWGLISFVVTPFILIGNIYSFCSRKNVVPADFGFRLPAQAAFPDAQRLQQPYAQAYTPPPSAPSTPLHDYDLSDNTAEHFSSEDMPQQDEKQPNDKPDSGAMHKWDL